MFQACGVWLTQAICNEYSDGDDTPANGFDHGFNNFGALYYEIYLEDLQHPDFQPAFAAWHEIIWTN